TAVLSAARTRPAKIRWRKCLMLELLGMSSPNVKKVQIMLDELGGPYRLTRIYLAEKTGRFLAPKGAARYSALEWLAVQLSTVGPMFGQYTHFKMFAPPG